VASQGVLTSWGPQSPRDLSGHEKNATEWGYSPLETAEEGMCQDMGRKRACKGHPRAGTCGGSDVSENEERVLVIAGRDARWSGAC